MRPIADVYRELCETPSDINEHLRHFVELATRINAHRVIELGVRHGVSTVAWLHAMELTGGHLWSADRDFPSEDGPVRTVPHDRWTFVLGRDDAPETLQALPPICDLVFIDTAHTLAQTMTELELYARRVRSGGYIILHDTLENAVEPDYPVRTAIERFTSIRRATWANYPYNNGLGVISL